MNAEAKEWCDETMIPVVLEGFDHKGNGEFFSMSAHPTAFAIREHFCKQKFGAEFFKDRMESFLNAEVKKANINMSDRFQSVLGKAEGVASDASGAEESEDEQPEEYS